MHTAFSTACSVESESKKYSARNDITRLNESDLMREWRALADGVDKPESECVIAMVGKYVDQGDACKFVQFS